MRAIRWFRARIAIGCVAALLLTPVANAEKRPVLIADALAVSVDFGKDGSHATAAFALVFDRNDPQGTRERLAMLLQARCHDLKKTKTGYRGRCVGTSVLKKLGANDFQLAPDLSSATLTTTAKGKMTDMAWTGTDQPGPVALHEECLDDTGGSGDGYGLVRSATVDGVLLDRHFAITVNNDDTWAQLAEALMVTDCSGATGSLPIDLETAPAGTRFDGAFNLSF